MKFQFTLIPIVAAATVAPTALYAENFMTLEEAQQRIFPDAQLTPADFTLSPADVARLRSESGTAVLRPQVRMWSVSGGGWLFLDQVLGRDDRVTYVVGLDATGSIKAIEVLVCADGYDQIRRPAWRQLFVAKRYTGVHLMREIPSISGATLSAAHISDGVTRVLATFALFVAPRGG